MADPRAASRNLTAVITVPLQSSSPGYDGSYPSGYKEFWLLVLCTMRRSYNSLMARMADIIVR
jgi:hypothetical protein